MELSHRWISFFFVVFHQNAPFVVFLGLSHKDCFACAFMQIMLIEVVPIPLSDMFCSLESEQR